MSTLLFVGQFINSKVGATGLTVTVDVDRYTLADGTRSALVTGGAATEGRRGLYHYRLANADLATYQYVATFLTAGTADQQEIAALGLVLPDELVGSRLATAGYTAPDNAGITAVKAKTDNLPGSPAAVGSAMALTAGAIADVTAAAQAGGVTVQASVAVSRAEAEDVASGRLSIRSYHTWSQEVSSTSTAALDTATKTWLIVKRSPDQTDDEALLRIEAGTGLERLAGAAYATAGHGSLVLGGSAGAWTITAGLDKVATGLLHVYAASGLYAEIKAQLPSGATVPVWDGKAAIHKGIVQSVYDDGGGIPT